MTRLYSDSIALAAQNIVQSSGVDITQPVTVLPLAKQLMAETGCSIDTAKRHIARAVRLARGELTPAPTWGGRRTPAGGRPKMKAGNIDTKTEYLPGSTGSFIYPNNGTPKAGTYQPGRVLSRYTGLDRRDAGIVVHFDDGETTRIEWAYLY